MQRPQALPSPCNVPKPPQALQALVFDLDGTLIDGYEAISISLTHAMTALGEDPWDAGTVRRHVGRGLEALLADAVGEERANEGVRLFREKYPEVYIDHSRLLPDVAETLGRLGSAGYRMGVATNKPAKFSREILRALGLGELLPFCWGPELVGRPKPDPEMVMRLLEELETDPEDALYVGDMPVDIETARAAGLPVWVVDTGSATRDELEAAHPDRILNGFAEIADLLAPGVVRGPDAESGDSPRSRSSFVRKNR